MCGKAPSIAYLLIRKDARSVKMLKNTDLFKDLLSFNFTFNATAMPDSLMGRCPSASHTSNDREINLKILFEMPGIAETVVVEAIGY